MLLVDTWSCQKENTIRMTAPPIGNNSTIQKLKK